MTIHEFLVSPSEAAHREGPHNKIVMSSRVRLARNIKGAAFPGWAKKAERIRTLEAIRPAVESLPQMADHLLRGERVAVLADEPELSPTDAAAILGISRPLVVHRMDVGDLPFRYVGKHRRTKLKDVLALKEKLDAQQKALAALAEDSEELMRDHDL